MGAECWQMTACEGTSHTRLSPCRLPRTGLISMLTIHQACESAPLFFSRPGPSPCLPVYLFIYDFVPLRSHVSSGSLSFFFFPSSKTLLGSLDVSLLCVPEAFLFATCWCPPRSNCFVTFKRLSGWKDGNGNTQRWPLRRHWSFCSVRVPLPKRWRLNIYVKT